LNIITEAALTEQLNVVAVIVFVWRGTTRHPVDSLILMLFVSAHVSIVIRNHLEPVVVEQLLGCPAVFWVPLKQLREEI